MVSDLSTDKWGYYQLQKRSHEDVFQCKNLGQFRYFGVFDGHGGSNNLTTQHVADYCSKHLHERLGEKLFSIDINNVSAVKDAIVETFVEFDTEMKTKGLLYGSTASVVLIDDANKRIYQINLGDSRSILFDNFKLLSTTVDHNPLDPIEKQRIVNAGGVVYQRRVMGMLLISRSFGDFDLKMSLKDPETKYDCKTGILTAIPDIIVIEGCSDGHIIITSDAPFEKNAFNNDSLVELFYEVQDDMTEPNVIDDNWYNKIAWNMVNAIGSRTTDDITILIVKV